MEYNLERNEGKLTVTMPKEGIITARIRSVWRRIF